ncbi:hypothetical protein [Xanthocytophaga flava]|uniref:hypothetical protein n=1 Tax=Xanthocytophaga flava TaxID=3048013 RepID=UPI0028D86D8A|nr:hypothetical protein [Xanthocytophaga flavus]MDJ1470342.1 hypothetical protein [Xanthocytophaga flavus]
MKIIILMFVYWYRAIISKWAIDDLIDAIKSKSWGWAKKSYDKKSKPMTVRISDILLLEDHAFVQITEIQALSERKAATRNFLFSLILILLEGFFVSTGWNYVMNKGTTLDSLSLNGLLLLLVTGILTTIVIVLSVGCVFHYQGQAALEKNTLKLKIPFKQLYVSDKIKIAVYTIAVLGQILNVFLNYTRSINITGQIAIDSISIFVLAATITSCFSGYLGYAAYQSYILYKAYKKKRQYEKLVAQHNTGRTDKRELIIKLSDQAATTYMPLITYVRALLKYKSEKRQNPEDFAQLRDYLIAQFNEIVDDTEAIWYQKPTVPPDYLFSDMELKTASINGKTSSAFFTNSLIVLTAAGLTSCDFIESKLKNENKEIRILLDVSGTTTSERWNSYKKGVKEIVINLEYDDNIVAYSIDDASYTKPVRMFEINFANGQTNSIALKDLLKSLPDTLRPPFKRRGEYEKESDVIQKRFKPFIDKIWPILELELDSIAISRKPYFKYSNILGAISNLEQDFTHNQTHKKDNSNSGFLNLFTSSQKKTSTSYWLFIFSDMVHSSQEGLNFERPLGPTRIETENYLNILRASNKISALPEVNVVCIGKGVVPHGPSTDEGVDNIMFFWTEYFKNTQGKLIRYGSLDDVNDIGEIIRQ